jgi:AraC family transcriptional regulator, regulatory protein of adaptative response / DNA-3-methyladenine glycosylase II
VLDPVQCYEAVRARDKRFDGWFFVAVKSTRIYCRPICPSRRPKFENCSFYRHAAAAELAGFRPCLRCRPELAPGLAPVDQKDRLAAAALRQLEMCDSVTRLGEVAEKLRISDRHLRRIVHASVGVSPVRLLQTQRLLLAKRLLTDSNLSVMEVALASGFASLRRFNASFRNQYQLTPTGLRKQTEMRPHRLVCFLSYRPPFDWDRLLAFLAKRLFAGVEQVEAGQYRRSVRIEQREGWISVENDSAHDRLRVEVSTELLPVLSRVIGRVRHLFDLDASPDRIASGLGSLASARPGLRVPGAFSGFEIALRAILGQQVSVVAATTLAKRMAMGFGKPFSSPFANLNYLSPRAETLAKASPEEIAKIGMPLARARCISALAQAVKRGDLDLETSPGLDQSLKNLGALPGMGEWTVQYVAMRAYAYPDAFPASDLGLMRALKVNKPKAVIRLGERWRPWRAYAVMHLWNALENKNEEPLLLP